MKRLAFQQSTRCIRDPSRILLTSVMKGRVWNGEAASTILKKAGLPALAPCQIYLRHNRVPFVFSRVKATKKKEAERCKEMLIAKYEDQAWAEERLKREFLQFISQLRK